MRGSGVRIPLPAPLFRLLSLLPLPVLYALCGGLARVLRLVRWRRALIESHIARCLKDVPAPRQRELARGYYGYLGRTVAEAIHGQRIDRAELLDRVRLDNPEIVVDALAKGQRIMVLAAHHANWEWLLLACSAAFDTPLVAAYKPPKQESVKRALDRLRERFGAKMVPAKDIVKHLLASRGSVRLLALVADQSPQPHDEGQVWLPFFGVPTAFFTGPGLIGSKLGFRPFLAAMRAEGRGRYAVQFVPLAEPGARPNAEAIVEAYARALEVHIRSHPGEYFWAYNRWKRARRLYD